MLPSTDEAVFDAFRRWGYLAADLDPVGYLQPLAPPELALEGDVATRARRCYCGSIGAEFMHIPDGERRQWIAERMEADPPPVDSARVLDRLIRAGLFEQVLQSRYPGTKRFSLEGIVTLIPVVDEVLECAADLGAEQLVLAMSHRGRLNVMVHIVGKSAEDVFARFEDVDPRSFLGGGDVKYHLGATGDYMTANRNNVEIHMVSNPSHLEAVDPVAVGRARAKQARLCGRGTTCVLPLLLHGDAALAGQGTAAETLNLAGLDGYTVGGTVHVVVNNLIGFTANPEDTSSSRFASDVAKRLPIPIFHVNAEDPDAAVRVARWAVEYRYKFHSDVVVDLIGYRRHGHSEIDDPTTTQPVRYRRIAALPPVWESYARRHQTDAAPRVAEIRGDLEAALVRARTSRKSPSLRQLPSYWDAFQGGRYDPALEVPTAVSAEELRAVGELMVRVPAGFSIHPKVKKLLDQRVQMTLGRQAIDFGTAELLAYGTLLRQKTPVRLSGQDTRRGTFNQRHATLFDTETEAAYTPLANIALQQPAFEVYDSPLSEAGVLGFEYGYSRDYPETLVLWEAQFGDFANGAQVYIDQFIAAGEDKWGLLSGVVLLLPHGYEGQGPEHSSARLERFLQLCARDNMQICQPTTAAQYFHMLRRQALRRWRKPLVVFTPKGMLRHPAAASPLAEFTSGSFLPVIPDREAVDPTRVLLATGRIVHALRAERKKLGDKQTAIFALEQLYPFPDQELLAALKPYRAVREVVWVQEEPANMGALFFVMPRLRRLAKPRSVLSVKLSDSPSPATGSGKGHEVQQKTLLALAFTTAKAQ
ncbi:MAG: 2-oxoglutarate dehydrogenase E1 component [Terriglobia bacterium]|jgi:2-oxoglutarate dehydrogenase E1 component